MHSHPTTLRIHRIQSNMTMASNPCLNSNWLCVQIVSNVKIIHPLFAFCNLNLPYAEDVIVPNSFHKPQFLVSASLNSIHCWSEHALLWLPHEALSSARPSIEMPFKLKRSALFPSADNVQPRKVCTLEWAGSVPCALSSNKYAAESRVHALWPSLMDCRLDDLTVNGTGEKPAGKESVPAHHSKLLYTCSVWASQSVVV